MKVELEFELLKDVPKIETLIAGRVYGMDCIDKTKDVKAVVLDEGVSMGFKQIGWTCGEGDCERIHEGPAADGEYAQPVYVRVKQEPLEWPNLITLSVRHMPEEVKP